MAKIADGDAWAMPSTIENPAAVTDISEVLDSMGYPKNTEK